MSPTENNLVSIHRKHVFVEAAVSSTTCQGTREKCCPPMNWALSKQTLVLVVDPEVAHELAPGSLDQDPGALENTDLGDHPWMSESFWKSRSPTEKFQRAVGAKNIQDQVN